MDDDITVENVDNNIVITVPEEYAADLAWIIGSEDHSSDWAGKVFKEIPPRLLTEDDIENATWFGVHLDRH